ncbi:MAG: CRISPR-associated endonuclease Cas3'' [bacterium]
MSSDKLYTDQYWAHSINENENPHLLHDHLEHTSRLTQIFGRKFQAEEIGRVIGLLHDLGKFNDEFQSYLRNKGDSVDHKKAGAYRASKQVPFLGLPIEGHHGDYPTGKNLRNLFNDMRKRSHRSNPRNLNDLKINSET